MVVERIWCLVVVDLICDDGNVGFHFQFVVFGFLICRFELGMRLRVRVEEARNGSLRFYRGFSWWCEEGVTKRGFYGGSWLHCWWFHVWFGWLAMEVLAFWCAI